MLVDVSSIVKTSLFAGKDEEFGCEVVFEGRKVQVNSAGYGLSNAINMLTAKMRVIGATPRDLILVVEGYNSKALRKSMWDGYKANRDDYAPEVNTQCNLCRDQFVQTFLDLGAQSVTQSGIEADDVIAYLAQELSLTYIVSNDGDLQRCISPKAHVIDKDNQVDVNRYGPFGTQFTTVYKALVGDSNDNIKGARGFGPKAFLDLLVVFGDRGLELLEGLIVSRTLEKLTEDVEELPALQKILDDMEGVYLSYDLAKLYPDKVNTLRRPLEWRVGMVKPKPERADARLEQWYGRRKLVNAGNYDATIAHMRAHIGDRPVVFLDIETSSPRESDEWLAELTKKDPDADDLGVDVLGHELTSVQMTYGDNDQYTVYFPVDHTEDDGNLNVTSQQALDAVKLVPKGSFIAVHNASFELSVLHRTWAEKLGDNGWHGFLPNVIDTMIMSSYVDENEPKGLKENSGRLLKYNQLSYKDVTQGRKMNELSATEAFDYGCDDPICTAAIYNHFRLVMDIERTWDVFLQVEQLPAYLHALAYNQGFDISREELRRQEVNDQKAYDEGWKLLREYLIKKGWQGSVCPEADNDTAQDPAFVKHAFNIVTGRVLETKMRKFEKLIAFAKEKHADHPDIELFANLMYDTMVARFKGINELLKLRFNGEPEFNIDSPVQVSRLLYEVMKLPVRLTNNATDKQRAEGRDTGNPRTDDLSMQYAVQYDAKQGSEELAVLKAVQSMKIANTRKKLYYRPYRYVFHWKDGKVHPSFFQSAAVTRRATCSRPNAQQWPKHPKATGVVPEFRGVVIPHHRRAVVLSKDFSGQELVIMAKRSRDPNLVACYVGDNKKDVHSLTAAGILKRKAISNRFDQLWTMGGYTGDVSEEFRAVVRGWKEVTYEQFITLATGHFAKLFKTLRALGKKTNFTTEYGAMAPKLAETLLVEIDEAQQYIDAKFGTFPRLNEWKEEVIQFLHKHGYTTTILGARRHLRKGLLSGSGYEIGSAERQGVNAEVQSSASEQTKIAMAGFWSEGIYYKYDARFIGPIHDEVVDSVGIDDLIPFLRESHAIMVRPYGGDDIPIVSSISFGLNFKDQIEVGETVNPALVRATLAQLFPNETADARWRKPYAFELEPMRIAA